MSQTEDTAGTTVRGEILLAVINSLGHERVRNIVEKYELDWIGPDEWYPLTLLIDIFNQAKHHSEVDMRDLGREVHRVLYDSAENRKAHLARVMSEMNASYRHNHRGKVGHFHVELVSSGHLVVEAEVPYPDDFVYGGLYHLAQTHLPDRTFQIKYDEHRTRRDLGGYSTRMHVYWE